MLNPLMLRLMVDDRTRELRGLTSGSTRRAVGGAGRRRAAATLRLLKIGSRRS